MGDGEQFGDGERGDAVRADAMSADRLLFDYLLRLADSDIVLAQRLGEWVGKGPVLEEDIAQTNVGLDLLGQGRLWLAYAGEIEARVAPPGRDENQLAFLRDGGEYRNLLLVEQPNGSYADTLARQFLYDRWHLLLLDALSRSRDERIAAIAAKAHKEVRYHIERSSGWVVRLGDGTNESHQRMQQAIDALWMYTGEMFAPDAVEHALHGAGIAANVAALHAPWREAIGSVLTEATLAMPADGWMQGVHGSGGRQGVHTEHLGYLLAVMQSLPRSMPDARW